MLTDPAFYVGIATGLLGGFWTLALLASHPRENDDEAQARALRLWSEQHREAETIDMKPGCASEDPALPVLHVEHGRRASGLEKGVERRRVRVQRGGDAS